MIGEELFRECANILSNTSLLEEEQTEKVEQLIAKRTGLTGPALEAQALDVLWRHRNAGSPAASPLPTRATIVRKASPAPWQQIARVGTPIGTPPLPPPGFPATLMPNASPFPSPRPSPRLAYTSPRIPHSPSLSVYESYPTDLTPSPELFGDYIASDNVAWIVGEDGSGADLNNASNNNGGGYLNGGQNGLMQQENMSPHDMLRSVLGDGRSDEEMDKALEASGYDLSATLSALMEKGISESYGQFYYGADGNDNINSNININSNGASGAAKTTTITSPSFTGAAAPFTPAPTIPVGATIISGKSATTLSPQSDSRSPGRPTTPRNGVVCRFFLSTGTCLRADCRFSHDLSSTICKYWLNGSCLAGETCIFSHDPSQSANNITTEQAARIVPTTPPPQFQIQDFPLLSPNQWPIGNSLDSTLVTPPPGFKNFPLRPHSRNQNRSPSPAIMNVPSVDDTEAFPTLGSAKSGRKNNRRNKNNNNNNYRENMNPMFDASPKGIPTGPSSLLADVVGRVTSPSPSNNRHRYNHVVAASPPARSASPYGPKSRAVGKAPLTPAAAAIPPPQQIPWLDTGNIMNKTYLRHRQAAIKHGQMRNKYLGAAAQAWGRNDPKAAKSFSQKGQSEQAEMRKAHREAAAAIYEQRQKHARENSGTELFVDLHGLHPDEAVEYLEGILLENQSSIRPIYAITGTGHHSKNGKDKVQRAIRQFLDHWGYVFREFSAQGDRGGMGGILGIDPRSYNKDADKGGDDRAHHVVGNAIHAMPSVKPLSIDTEDDGILPINADGQSPSGTTGEMAFKIKESRKGSKSTTPSPPPGFVSSATTRVVDSGGDSSDDNNDSISSNGVVSSILVTPPPTTYTQKDQTTFSTTTTTTTTTTMTTTTKTIEVNDSDNNNYNNDGDDDDAVGINVDVHDIERGRGQEEQEEKEEDVAAGLAAMTVAAVLNESD